MSEYIEWLNEQIKINKSKMLHTESSSSKYVYYGRATALVEAKEKLQEIESQKIDKMGEHYGEK